MDVFMYYTCTSQHVSIRNNLQKQYINAVLLKFVYMFNTWLQVCGPNSRHHELRNATVPWCPTLPGLALACALFSSESLNLHNDPQPSKLSLFLCGIEKVEW